MLLDRDYTPDHLVKLGIDSGGSFLKMSLSVINTFKEGDETKNEQATEAMHSKLKMHWNCYKRCQSHQEYVNHFIKKKFL